MNKIVSAALILVTIIVLVVTLVSVYVRCARSGGVAVLALWPPVVCVVPLP